MASTINPDAVSVLVPATDAPLVSSVIRDNFTAIKAQFTAAVADIEGVQVIEGVAGGAGFTNVSGPVALDLSLGRAFLHTATGNMTGPTFTNVPSSSTTAASWVWVLAIDATARTLTGTPTVTWLDGSAWTDMDLGAGKMNIVQFIQLGTVTYAALLWNGGVVAGVDINTQTGTTYTFVLADAGKLVTLSNAGAITVTVPTNASVAFPVGTVIALQQLGVGAVSVVGATGVTINGTAPGSEALTAGQYTSSAALTKHAADTWTLTGAVV